MDTREIRYETPLTKFLFNKAATNRIPLSGTFELSPICNFDCRMCYVRQTPEQVEKHSRKMRTLQEWKEVADQAAEMGMLYLLLTGGEPLLWPDFWELYEYLVQKGFVISINTNGSLIDEKAVEKFREMPPSRINITLYGASDKTYEKLCRNKKGFTMVDKAISMLQEVGINVKLNCSLTPYNCEDLEKIIGYAQKRKLILEIVTYMFPPLRKDPTKIGENDRFTAEESAQWRLKRYRLQYGEEHYKKYLQDIVKGMADPLGIDENCYDPVDGKVRCRAGKAAFWATWDGWLLPCGMMTKPAIDLENKLFAEAWQELLEVTGKIKLSGVCSKCGNQSICHACAAMALAETGEFEQIPKYLCEMMHFLRKQASEQLRIYGM